MTPITDIRRSAGLAGLVAGLLLTVAAGPAAAGGTVSYRSSVTEADNPGIAGVSAVVMSPDGGHIYAAGANDGAVVAFRRDVTGDLAFQSARHNGDAAQPSDSGPVSGLQLPVALAMDAPGTHLYAVSADGAVVVFTVAAGGDLTFIQTVQPAELAQALAVAVSPDGATVYVTGKDTRDVPLLDAFAVSASGLTHLQTSYGDPAAGGGITGLRAAVGIAVAHDGKSVYVNGQQGIAVFSRDTASGVLTPIQVLDKGRISSSGAMGGGHVRISADDAFFYAAVDQGVMVLQREPATGVLTISSTLSDGQTDAAGNTVAGLAGADAVELSPDDSQLYVASTIDSALAVFRRDPDNGGLTFADVLYNGQGGVAALGFPVDLAVSPDGLSLYSAANHVSAIGVFDVATADVGVAMTVDNPVVNTGGSVAFALTVQNHDAVTTATHVTVTDFLPPGLSFVSASTGQGSCAAQGQAIVCTVGDLAAGATAAVSLAASVGAGRQFINSARVSADQRDGNPSNDSANATVVVNTPPVAANDSAVVNPGATVVIDVLANDSDADGDMLSVTAFDSSTANGGTIAASGDELAYTAAAGFRGNDRFHYTVSDRRGGAATASVSVTVNTPPTAVDDTATATAGTPVTIYVLVNDYDSDGEPLSMASVSTPSAHGGTVTTAGDGTVRYAPAAGFTGTDHFGYVIADGSGAVAAATVTVTVQPGAPVTPGTTGTGGSEAGGPSGGGSLDSRSLWTMLWPALWRATRRRP